MAEKYRVGLPASLCVLPGTTPPAGLGRVGSTTGTARTVAGMPPVPPPLALPAADRVHIGRHAAHRLAARRADNTAAQMS